MRAVVMTKYGGKGVVEIRDVPRPEIQDHEVLVEVNAASVNPVDFKLREGKLKLILPLKFPAIMGNDFAGTIVAVGNRVRNFKVGDQVYGRPDKHRFGTFTELLSISEEEIALKPKNISMVEAASLPLVGLTAWQALNDIGMLKNNQKVFIPAGSGGVGSFAIQLAKVIGATVATTTSEKNMAFVKSLGADIVIDYKNQSFSDELKDKDYDLIFDTVGGPTLLQSFRILKEGGTVVSIAGIPDSRLAREMDRPFWVGLLLDLASSKIRRVAWKTKAKYFYLFMRPSGAQLREIALLVEAGKIKPVVETIFPLDKAIDALAHVESGRTRGKVVIEVK